jgi:hypothetical protein
VYPPGHPDADDPSDANFQVLTFAMRTIDLGIRLDGGPVPSNGFDLDHVFTCCHGGRDSCVSPVEAGAHCDNDGGRDNSATEFLNGLDRTYRGSINPDAVTFTLEQGVSSVLVQLASYNGQPNDTQLIASFYSSPGVQTVGDAAPAAKWDGTDVWTIDHASVLNGADAAVDAGILPSQFDVHAYVAGGVLVMHLDLTLRIDVSYPNYDFLLAPVLTGASVTARIVRGPGGTYTLREGQIGARWSVASALDVMMHYPGGVMCPGTPVFTLLKPQICSAADIMTDPTKDNTGASCNGLSITYAFTADPARLGPVVPTSDTPPCNGASPGDCTSP